MKRSPVRSGQSRLKSILILAAVYLLAAGAGIGVYLVLPLPFWLSLLLADVVATVAVYCFSLIFKNASVYDPYWSVQPLVILTAYAIAFPITPAFALFFAVVTVWGIRLTANWAYTFKGLDYEDWRYTMLREKTGHGYFFVNFTGIHLVPTLVVYACTLPAVFVSVNAPPINAGCAFLLLSLFGAVMQGVADFEMHRFRKRVGKGFIRDGLWKYSRHPNYLGEILQWWGVGLAAVCLMPDSWWLLAGALANTLLFLCVSIPLADGRQSRKEGFASYRANTRMLLPIYKKQRVGDESDS